MTNNNGKLRLAVAHALGAGIALAVAAGPAVAQQQAAAVRGERIEVTGSNIKRIEGETALPVTVISRKEFEAMGAQSTEDVVRLISANTAMYSNTTQGVGYAVSNANLRGIGASSTLVLLNGRRLANQPFGSIGGFNAAAQAVDLNTIPFSAIERVEVLRDGASAVYGSDAVGGVINFITRVDYHGAEATVYYGAPEQHYSGRNGSEASATASLGFGDLATDGWNTLISGRWQYFQRLKAIDQKLYARANDIEGATYPTSFRGFPGRIMDFGISPGAYVGTLLTDPNFSPCDPDRTVRQIAGNPTPSGDPAIRCRGIYASYLDNLPDNHRGDIFGRFVMNVGGGHQFFGEASYAQNHNIGRVAPVPIDQTAAHIRPDGTQANILLPITSRYAPVDLLRRLGYDPTQTGTPGFLEIAYRSEPAGNRINDITSDQSRLSAGFKGGIAGWDYDTALTYASATSKLKFTGYIQETRFVQALATGNLNPFGPNDAVGQALLDGAKMEGDMRKSTSKTTQLDGKIAKDFWKMGGGTAAVAFGADLRREQIDDKPLNSDYETGQNIGGEGTVPHTNASRNVGAVFTELSMPFVKDLEVTVAARWDHYSDVGSKGTPQIRARYQPVKEWLLRASAGKGFRAPSLWDLNSPPSFGNSANSLRDPGCPADLLANEDPRCVDTQLNIRNIASPNLKPETSTQWSAGFLWEPTRTLSFALDYWNIEKKDAIGSITADTILANPNDLTLYNRFQSRFVRSANGVTLYVDQPLENLGELKTSGFDVDARASLDAPYGTRMVLSFTGTYIDTYELQPGRDLPFISYLGNSFNGGNAYPRWTHVASIDMSNGPWGGTLEQTFVNGWTEAFQGGGTHVIPSTSRVNAQVRYMGFKKLSLKLGVRNLMDRLPPYTDVSSYGSHAVGWANSFADPRGRFWWGSITYTFK